MFEDNSFEKNKICDLETKEYLRSNRSESGEKNAHETKGYGIQVNYNNSSKRGGERGGEWETAGRKKLFYLYQCTRN